LPKVEVEDDGSLIFLDGVVKSDEVRGLDVVFDVGRAREAVVGVPPRFVGTISADAEIRPSTCIFKVLGCGWYTNYIYTEEQALEGEKGVQ
jgi:hypothetical protein